MRFLAILFPLYMLNPFSFISGIPAPIELGTPLAVAVITELLLQKFLDSSRKSDTE